MTNSEFLSAISSNAAVIEKNLSDKLDLIKNDGGYEKFKTLENSMRYSLLAGGKRIRPCLVIEFARLFGGNDSADAAFDYACAIEMVHTFSLIHDDMPCMDNDELRRGKPTNHKVFGESTALLAGDATLAYAFEVLPSARLSDKQNLAAYAALAKYTGPCGMCGGQQIDLENEGKKIALDTLQTLHAKKTGALIKCSCILGCIAAGFFEGSREYEDACEYACDIGLAFQIADDILDVTGDENKLGKKCGSDEKDSKNTYVTILGIQKAEQTAAELCQKAKSAISKYNNSSFLCSLADYVINRES